MPEDARAATLGRLADALIALTRPHPLRVAIDGRSAAGKTTLADDLAPLIAARGRPALRVAIDDFHRPRAVRHRRQDLPAWRRYYDDTFDHAAIRATFLPLGPGGDRRYRRAIFDLAADRPIAAPWLVAPADAIVLADGVFLFRPELDDLWDMRLYVAIDGAETLRRGPARDAGRMGSAAAAARRYAAIYIPAEDHYRDAIDPEARADIVMANRDPAAPRLIARSDDGAPPRDLGPPADRAR